jgi:acyl-CoA thioesterase FadM
MGWAAYSQGTWSMTARMSTRFRRPVPLGHPLRIEGRVTRVRKSFLAARAEIRLDGVVVAEGEGIFLRVYGERAREMQALYRQGADSED